MCGISGWFVRPGVNWRPTKDMVCEMVKGVEDRGRDATGYGTIKDDGGLFIYKGPVASWKWIKDFQGADHPIGRVGILHTRGANVGTPDENNNNHPVTFESDERQVMAVHNGTIGNLDECYKKLGIERTTEVDSALIAAALGVLGPLKGIEFLAEESGGSAAFAALFDDGSLMLARDTSPLYVAIPQPGVLLWSSNADPLKVMSSADSEFGLPFWRVSSMADARYHYWSANGDTVGSGKFRMPAGYKAPTYLRDKTAQTALQTVTGFQPARGLSELEKHLAGARGGGVVPADAPLMLVGNEFERASRGRAERKLTMEPEHNIPCNWVGCWKKSIYRVHWNLIRWVPLCHKHTNKWEHKGSDLILSGTHEMGRKITSLVQGRA